MKTPPFLSKIVVERSTLVIVFLLRINCFYYWIENRLGFF